MKHVYTIFIFLICLIFVILNLRENPLYEVKEVIAPDIICVDFNNNGSCDVDEKVKLYGINAFPEKFGDKTDKLKIQYNIEDKNSVVLGVLSKDYTKKQLLNKFVDVKTIEIDEKEKYKIAKVFADKADFSQTMLQNGWATTTYDEYKIYENLSAIKKNISFSKKFNYQLRNKKNNKIHTLDCEYGRKAKDYEIGIFDDEKYLNDYCQVCHKKQPAKNPVNYDFETETLKVYFLDFTNQLKPDKKCSTKSCKILLENINKSTKSIDFAIYGAGDVPEIAQALLRAKQRGVKIRFVYDINSKKENIYNKTDLYIKNFDSKNDYVENESTKFNNFIMHNKFFIFDNSKVWLGTANLSETDLSGFNANNIIFIKSKPVAQLYENEFENLYKGFVHTKKVKTPNNIISKDIKAAFSPQDDIITNFIIPEIKNAQKSIYIESFIITHKNLTDELINAHSKGVDVKIIVDATTANSNYSMVSKLRSNKIPVKIENYAGKMHMKTITIDNKYFISGSMNLTKSGEKYNDENIIIIKNVKLAQQSAKFFEYLWVQIPDKYLKLNISAESKYSIGSCTDGIDNDYDGKTDSADSKCH